MLKGDQAGPRLSGRVKIQGVALMSVTNRSRTSTKPQARQRKMMLDDEFYCRPRRRRLSLEKCLEDYMNANAFGTKRAACWRCPQGCNIRRQFADDGV